MSRDVHLKISVNDLCKCVEFCFFFFIFFIRFVVDICIVICFGSLQSKVKARCLLLIPLSLLSWHVQGRNIPGTLLSR